VDVGCRGPVLTVVAVVGLLRGLIVVRFVSMNKIYSKKNIPGARDVSRLEPLWFGSGKLWLMLTKYTDTYLGSDTS
jgi:hypothetical protein